MIGNRLEEINYLRSLLSGTTGQNGGDRVQISNDKDKISAYVSKIVDSERCVDNMIDKRLEIINQIESMKNVNYYDTLAQRYILGKDLKTIAINRSVSFRHVKRLHREAILVFEKEYGKNYQKS